MSFSSAIHSFHCFLEGDNIHVRNSDLFMHPLNLEALSLFPDIYTLPPGGGGEGTTKKKQKHHSCTNMMRTMKS